MREEMLKNSFYKIFILFLFAVFIISCGIEYTPEQQKYIASIEKMRKEKDGYMKNDPSSPFNYDSNAVFHPLKYFIVDPNFVFKSKLYKYEKQDTIEIFGTKGEARKVVKYGYVKINYDKKDYKINVYQGQTKRGEIYHSIWFTDKTTNNESYGVGRYLDFEINNDKDFIYTIDFNQAYSPYCSYSAEYSCAIPTKEDYLDLEIKAGEKKFH